MRQELGRQIHDVLSEAFTLPEAKRVSFVLERCAGDLELSRCQAAMIRALGEEAFLAVPAITGLTSPESPPCDQVPSRIGNYQIVRPLGSGGMATVYEAIQDQPNRRVALKVSRISSRNSGKAEPRLRYESEVLARLRHPNIAQIHEAGIYHDSSHNLAWFALEFVPHARNLVEFATAEKLDLPRRLRLFCQACSAIQHGHQIGIIHRDLKPANILVDGDGHLKVIDFGIAQSTSNLEGNLQEGNSHELYGTPNYMSPEQYTNNQNVDARTDVYSLGLVLFELICGKLPRDLNKLSWIESQRVAGLELPIRPSQIDARVPKDVEAIILKCLSIDPEGRYPTAESLESDIKRYLDHYPVTACVASPAHQARLFARRNKLFVIAAVSAVAALLSGIVISLYFAVESRRESRARLAAKIEADAERDEAIWQSYVANVAAGFSSYRAHEYRQMRERLAAAPVQLRGWEWRLLQGLSEVSEATIIAHQDMIFDVAVSPTQPERFATACRDGTIKIWETKTLQALAEIEVTQALSGSGSTETQILALDFSPNGKWLAAGLSDGTIVAIDTETHQLIAKSVTLRSRVVSLSCGPDQSIVATYGNGRIDRWTLPEPKSSVDSEQSVGVVMQLVDRPQVLPLKNTNYRGAQFSTDRSKLALWDEEGHIWLQDASSGEVLFDRKVPESLVANRLEFSPDGSHMAVGCNESKIVIWDLVKLDGEPQLIALPDSQSTISALHFSLDGRYLFAGRNDRGIGILDLVTGRIQGYLKGHEETISGLFVDEPRRRLISASWDRSFRIWNLDPETQLDCVTTFAGHENEVMSGAWSPDGGMIASSSKDGSIRFWDPVRRVELGAIHFPNGEYVRSLSFSHQLPLLAAGSTSGVVHLIDARSGLVEREIAASKSSIWAVSFGPDGKQLATAGDDHVARVWDVPSGELTHEFKGHESRIIQVAFSQDGKHLATASRDETVRTWNLSTKQEEQTFVGHQADVFDLVFDPQGKHLFSGSRDQSIRVWDLSRSKPLDSLSGQGQFITNLSLSPEGKRLAASSWYGEVVIWDFASQRWLASFKAHDQAIRELAFSPDGDRLLTTSNDRTLKVFDARGTKVRNAHIATAQYDQKQAEIWLRQMATEAAGYIPDRAADNPSADWSEWFARKDFQRRAMDDLGEAPHEMDAGRRNYLLEKIHSLKQH